MNTHINIGPVITTAIHSIVVAKPAAVNDLVVPRTTAGAKYASAH
eukprot:COSAG06_NODE_26038_length_623_cov_0.906489_2_plen_44_part_01